MTKPVKPVERPPPGGIAIEKIQGTIGELDNALKKWEVRIMITFRVSAEVKDDRQVLITLPPEVPVGQSELVVSVETVFPQHSKTATRSSLADWAEQNAEHWGNQLSAADVEGFTGRRF
jgi:hypothetical protein